MKRSQVIEIIASWGKPEIFQDIYAGNHQEWADNLLYTLENEVGFRLTEVVDYGYDGSELQIQPYEPEEGWDKYFEEQDKKDRARDFKVIPKLNLYSDEPTTSRSMEISQKFLDGKSFEELAGEYNVTTERIRQIVAKQRRRYNRSLEGKDEKY